MSLTDEFEAALSADATPSGLSPAKPSDNDQSAAAAYVPVTPGADTVTIKVKSTNGKNVDVVVRKACSVELLREAVHAATEVEPARQRLIFQGKVLKDGQVLVFVNLLLR